MDFLENVACKFNDKTATAAEETFNQLLLPIPVKGEYYQVGHGSPTFLTDFAGVVRIHKDRYIPLLRSNHLLRPIAAIRLSEGVRLDIQPAGPICGSGKTCIAWTAKARIKAGEDEDILISDTSLQNYTLFPEQKNCPSDKAFEGLNFDPMRVNRISKKIRKIKTMLDGSNKVINLESLPDEKPDFQDVYFKMLREAFYDAHDPLNDKLAPEKIVKFWQIMAKAKEDKILSAPWSADNPDDIDANASCRGVPPIAESYAKRLRAESLIFRGFKAA